MTTSNTTRFAVRIDEANPLHHLWDNHGTGWIHFPIHDPDHTARRIRRSLGTKNRVEARRLRDRILSRKGGFSS
jgi:hypothetical protein